MAMRVLGTIAGMNVFDRIITRKKSQPPQGRMRLQYQPADFAAIYAIGDVHGCYELLVDAERRILYDAKGFPGPKLIVLLGDYVDRGERSADVIEHLCKSPPEGFIRVALCGNHDDAFFRFLLDPKIAESWLQFAGRQTLLSYGLDAMRILRDGGIESLAVALRRVVPRRHLDLLRAMPVCVEIGDVFFVHAGIMPGIPLAEQADEDMMWIREPFISKGPQMRIAVVHGHTPADIPFIGEGRIGIDTAAFATGKLTVVRIAQRDVRILA